MKSPDLVQFVQGVPDPSLRPGKVVGRGQPSTAQELQAHLLLAQAALSGFAERDAPLPMLNRAVLGGHRITLGAGRGYDASDFIGRLREHDVTLHVARSTHHRPGTDGRTTRHPGYAVSARQPMQIEKIFGWMKTVGGLRGTRPRGVQRTQLAAYIVGAALNLLRISRLLPETS